MLSYAKHCNFLFANTSCVAQKGAGKGAFSAANGVPVGPVPRLKWIMGVSVAQCGALLLCGGKVCGDGIKCKGRAIVQSSSCGATVINPWRRRPR